MPRPWLWPRLDLHTHVWLHRFRDGPLTVLSLLYLIRPHNRMFCNRHDDYIQTRKDRRPGGEEPRGIFRRLERCYVGFSAWQPMRRRTFARSGDLGGGALPGLIGSPVQLPRCGVGSVFLNSFRSVFTKQEIRVRVTTYL